MIAIMRWGMQRWSRLRMLNRLGGTWSVAAELDIAPGIASAAFFTMRLAPQATMDGSTRAEAILRAGRGIQRFWLEATQLGLAMQPTLATLVFAEYGAMGTGFTADGSASRRAGKLATAFRAALGTGPEAYVFMGRIGEGRARLPLFRSIRRELAELILSPTP
jgi:hypothetical protein